MRSRKTTIIFAADAGRARSDSDLGLLFEMAPDALNSLGKRQVYFLKELAGDSNEHKIKAFQLARQLLLGEPAQRGIQQLSVVEELVIRELQFLFFVQALHDKLVGLGYQKCQFEIHYPVAKLLAWFSNMLGTGLQVTSPQESSPLSGSIRRSFTRLKEGKGSLTTIKREFGQIVDRLDPYRSRYSWQRALVEPKQKIWFYSTATTFTQIGLAYEPFFPQPFHYMLEAPDRGGVSLSAARREFFSPYHLLRRGMAPSRGELITARQDILEHLASVRLSNVAQELVRKAFLGSGGLGTFFSRLLPVGLLKTELFEAFVEQLGPSALVVGNPVFEGYALHACRRHNIPTVLLQHGILGDYCQFIDPPVDHYVVRGEFWRDFLSEEARKRAVILNTPWSGTRKKQPLPMAMRPSQVLFLTASYQGSPYLHERDLEDILLALVSACAQQEGELVVRVHPNEEPGKYMSTIKRILVRWGGQAKVSFSHGDGLEALVRRARVAVTFSSTVFLDCLNSDTPIVSFDWHDFAYKEGIKDYGVFYFAKTLAELESLVSRGLNCELSPYTNATDPFLAKTSVTDLKQALAGLVGEQGSFAGTV